MQFGVIYLETWGSTQSYVAFWTLEFSFVFGRTHMAPNSLTLYKPVSDPLIVIQAPALPACSMLLLWLGIDWTVELKIDISMNLKFKKSHEEILTAEWRTFASGPILH
jgi:hypothetical protein